MLAQNFMTAEALGITEEQLTVLIKTLGFFERGEVPSEQFAMNYWCGTAACIAGWTYALTNCRIVFQQCPPSLYDLFIPAGKAWDCTDPAKGAHALRNYLTTGDANWAGVMAEQS